MCNCDLWFYSYVVGLLYVKLAHMVWLFESQWLKVGCKSPLLGLARPCMVEVQFSQGRKRID
jgi:hypothetical protein